MGEFRRRVVAMAHRDAAARALVWPAWTSVSLLVKQSTEERRGRDAIETLSATATLFAGVIIATGTSVGVGIDFDPPRFLKPGDKVEIAFEGIGTLANPVA